MTSELERIEQMAAEGKITPEEAERLKAAIDDSREQEDRNSADRQQPDRPDNSSGSSTALKVFSWLITIVIFGATMIMGVILPFLVPRFHHIFMELNVDLPAPTRLLLSVPVLVYPLVLGLAALMLLVKELVIPRAGIRLLLNLLAAAMFVALVVVIAGSLYLPARKLQEMAAKADRSAELELAERFAEDSKALLVEYHRHTIDHPETAWKVRATDLKKLDPKGKLGLLEAIVISNDSVLLAAGQPDKAPTSVSGKLESRPSPGIQIISGKIESASLGVVACRLYTVAITEDDCKGTVRLVFAAKNRNLYKTGR